MHMETLWNIGNIILKIFYVAIVLGLIYLFIGSPSFGKSELEEMKESWEEKKQKALLAEHDIANEIINYFHESNINLKNYTSVLTYKCHPKKSWKFICIDCYIDEEGVIQIDDYENEISLLLPLPNDIILDSHSTFMVELFDVYISTKNIEIDLEDGVSTLEVKLPSVSFSGKLKEVLPTYYDFVKKYEARTEQDHLPISKINVEERVLNVLSNEYSVFFN